MNITPSIAYWNVITSGLPQALSGALAAGIPLDEEALAGLQTGLSAIDSGFKKGGVAASLQGELADLAVQRESGGLDQSRLTLQAVAVKLERIPLKQFSSSLTSGRQALLGGQIRFASTLQIRQQIAVVLSAHHVGVFPYIPPVMEREDPTKIEEKDIEAMILFAHRWPGLFDMKYRPALDQAFYRLEFRQAVLEKKDWTLSSLAASQPLLFGSEHIMPLIKLARTSWDAALALTHLAIKRSDLFQMDHLHGLLYLMGEIQEISLVVHVLAIRRPNLFYREHLVWIERAASLHRDAAFALKVLAERRPDMKEGAIQALKNAAVTGEFARELVKKLPYS